MVPTRQGQFTVDNTTLDTELFEEEFDTITAFYVVDENYGFTANKFELKKDVNKKELVSFGSVGVVLSEERRSCGGFGKSENGLMSYQHNKEL